MTVGVRQSAGLAGFVGSGAVAGAASAFAFTVLHQLLISPIWFALPINLVAGALCGVCLAWSYVLVVSAPTVRSWLQYNVLYLVMFVALGLTSLVAFEPVTTISALLQTNEPPRALIGRALPVTGLFTLATAALLSRIYRPGWRRSGGLLVTTTVLVLFLGLNISILGLVAIPRSGVIVLAEVLTLLVAIMAAYVAVVVALSRARFASAPSA
jgi:hypothetical protein